MKTTEKKIKGRGGHTRREFYEEMCADEGEWCKICGMKPPEVYLEIDHKDGNPKNNARKNRQFLCRSDNRKKNPRGKARRKALDPSIVDQPKVSSAEFQKNREAEPRFRHWLYEIVKGHGRILLNDAVNSGAEVANASQITIKRYIQKTCSGAGLYAIVHDSTLDAKVIEFRSAESLGISIDAEDDL